MGTQDQKEILEDLRIGSALGGNVAGLSAEELGNDPDMEKMWAIKAMEHADIYFNLLCAVDPKLLKLTQKDNEIYEAFRSEFSDFNVDVLDEDSLKSPSAKEKWRPFCNKFEHEIEEFSFATLVRINCQDEYSEANTILVTRIQFFCIEIARNREGLNDVIRKNFKPKPRTKTK